ncbi:penicillin-binding protein 1C [Lyngbya sp. PCC 8106]|uniref:penicillin-binding protein 1C n=1 Tax=Lyngbya sp. (strain PCC 8106) TaxID=313612 RepID=UPI0000EAAA4C|nr:penicillin-binding protein 1C [Lyngbya sp. PCC 8106]EAW35928.1 penicillin-binding protein 2 [Lyngbya sp. PCC 8106]
MKQTRWFCDTKIKVILAVILTGVTVRSIPYLAPIHAQDITQDSLAVEFSDRYGQPLGTLLSRDQNHTAVVPLAQVSPLFIQAIIAAEDKRYYQQGAVDSIAIVRAILEAIQAREIVSGASTITMQLARMLEPAPTTLINKSREIWLAWRLFAGMNKDEILQAYINRLPMGGNLYGVEAASRAYFNIPATDLSLSQASLLAALPNDPTDLNPYYNWQALKQRQRYVLDRMVAEGYITLNHANHAYQENVELQPPQLGAIAAPHFLFWVSEQMSNSAQNSHPKPHIQTTLDLNLQQFVEAQVRQVVMALSDQNVNHAAAIVIENKTGEVLAYVGSPNYFNTLKLGSNDGVQALRQPGSTLKPFLYELALEQDMIQPNTILADVPTYYAIPGAKLYTPTDYSETFLGPVRVRLALANSLNIPAVRVLEKVTVPVFLSHLQTLGFASLNHPPEHYGLGLSLGSGEVKLWELAQAYVTLANQGQVKPLVTILTTIPPQTCLENNQNCQEKTPQIHTPETWQIITDMLSDSHARAAAFGVESVLNLPFPVAVKTGTSSDHRDTWTVGFTPDYTVATWVGNFDGKPMQNVSGVMGAAPLWSRIMMQLHSQEEPLNFSVPAEFVKLPICATTGKKPTSDCQSGIVLEYFHQDDIPAYQNSAENLKLTSEYNEWLAQQNRWDLIPNQLRILSPLSDDYFLVDSDQSDQLEFKITTNTQQPVEWWLNDQKLATKAANSLFWQMQPGKWTLTVKQGDRTESIQFQVQVAEPKPYHRGFSIVESDSRK